MAERTLNVLTLRMSDGNVIKFEYYDTLPSTASLAREYAKAGYPDRYVVFAEHQTDTSLTHTKLKEGKTDRGIFMSVILRPTFFPSQAVLLGAMSATALYLGLEQNTTEKLGIGWISDIYCNGEFIGSTSREAKIDKFNTYEYLILNFGVHLDEKDFPPRLSDVLKQVFTADSDTIAMIVARGILDKFFPLYSAIKEPKSKFMEIYRKNFILRGKRIRYLDGEKKLCGKVLGVDDADGRLLIEGKEGNILRVGSRASLLLPAKLK